MNRTLLAKSLSAMAVIAYLIGIAYIWLHLNDRSDINYVGGFPSYFVTAIGAALGTHFGAVVKVGKFDKFEVLLAACYIGSLLACVAMWGYNANFDPRFLPAIRDLAVSLVGVLAGAFVLTPSDGELHGR